MELPLHQQILAALAFNHANVNQDTEDDTESVSFFEPVSTKKNKIKADEDDELFEEDLDLENEEDIVNEEIESQYVQSLKSTIFSEKFQEELKTLIEKILNKNTTRNKNALLKKLKEYSHSEEFNKKNKDLFVEIMNTFQSIFELSEEEMRKELEELTTKLTENLETLFNINKEKKEYLDCITSAQNGDQSAIEKIIAYVSPDAEQLAKKFSSFSLWHYSIYEDLYQEGLMWVLKGIKKFSPQRSDNVRLYMKLWLKQFMMAYLSTRAEMIKIPIHIKTLLLNIKKTIAQFDAENKSYTNKDIADKLKVTPKQVDTALKQSESSNVFMFSDLMTSSSDEEMTGDNFIFMKDSNANIEKKLFKNEEMMELRDMIFTVLNKEERFVLIYRAGLFDVETLLLKDIGEKLWKTEERIRQIEERAKEIIAITYFDKKYGRNFREKYSEMSL